MNETIAQITKAIVFGDSYSAAVVSDDVNSGGWPEMMCIPEELRLAVAGTTAKDWSSNDYFETISNTLDSYPDVNTAIVSLLGNDVMKAMADGVLSSRETCDMLYDLRNAVSRVATVMEHVVVILYPDPYFGKNSKFSIGIPIINGMIQFACLRIPGVKFFDMANLVEPTFFDGIDMHLNKIGHSAMAVHMKRRLELL